MSMLPVKQAESIILNLVQPLDSQTDVEVVDLSAAAGRILAAPVTSHLDFPHWDNSAMDGYAVLYADVASASEKKPAVLEIVEEIPAGKEPQRSIQPGQSARIFTGAVMPVGADTVVKQEQTRREGDRVLILAAPEPQAFVRHKASYYQSRTPLLPPGILLTAPEIAVLAAAQCTQLPVYRRPRVAILSTGDELVTPDQPLRLGQLVDSNQYALAAAVTALGAQAQPLGIISDKPEALKSAIAKAIATADIVLSTGGVSVGDYDYVREILIELGGEIHIQSVAVTPGKPLKVATFSQNREQGSKEVGGQGSHSATQTLKLKNQNSPPQRRAGGAVLPEPVLHKAQRSVIYVGLPGNPVSALVTFWRFIQPALKKLSGLSQGWEPAFVTARSRSDLRSDGKLETHLWGRLLLLDGTYGFQLAGGTHNSGNLINLAQTSGLAIMPVGRKFITAGEQVQVLAVRC